MTNIFTFEIGLILPLSKHKNCPLSLSFSFSPLERSNLSLSSIYITLPRAPLTVRTSKKKNPGESIERSTRLDRHPLLHARIQPPPTRASTHRVHEYRPSPLVPPATPAACLLIHVCVCTYLLPTRWWSKGVAGRMPGDRR